MTHVAPRIVNNVSFVSRINHEIHFSWQAKRKMATECEEEDGVTLSERCEKDCVDKRDRGCGFFVQCRHMTE